MQAPPEITLWHWVIFTVAVLGILAFDLGLFHRRSRTIGFKEAIGWTLLWVLLAVLFGAGLVKVQNIETALEFFTGYVIELSLSIDNVMVIALIFAAFHIPQQYQHRVLLWGILVALLLRGVMIWLGMALIQRFDWILYVFGIFLALTGLKMLLTKDDEKDPTQGSFARIARRFLPIATELDGQKFITRQNGRRLLTPLFLVLLLVETADLVFALDSIPAIFGVTHQPFIVFSSNIFAILGLRSLYFVLAGAMSLFRHLKIGLAVVLVFIGLKMLFDPHHETAYSWQREIPTKIALAVVVAIVLISILTSIIASRREMQTASGER